MALIRRTARPARGVNFEPIIFELADVLVEWRYSGLPDAFDGLLCVVC